MIAAATTAVLAAAVAVFGRLAAAVSALAVEGDGGVAFHSRFSVLWMGLDTCGEEEGGESDRGECDAHWASLTPTLGRDPGIPRERSVCI